MAKNVVVSLSGGMDSSTLLLRCLSEYDNVTALSFDYGQKHRVELERAKSLVEYLNASGQFIKYQVINQWKIKNKIQNDQINKINCSIKFFNLNELKYTKKILKEISIIEKIILKKISYNINNYDVYFYGDRNILFQLFELNNLILKINNNSCNIYLK